MAQVTGTLPTTERIDHYLGYVTAAWRGVPDTAAAWNHWDELSKLTFVLDWGVPADRLHALQQWAETGLLTPEQYGRYDELMALVAQHRATLDHLLSDDS